MITSNYRILAVDDVLDNLFLLQTLLEIEGYCVEIASDGASAIEKLKTTPPDLVLLDMMMPDIDGYEIIRRMQQDNRLATIPVLCITASDRADTMRRAQFRVDEVIQKPFDVDYLVNRIRKVLSSRSKTDRRDYPVVQELATRDRTSKRLDRVSSRRQEQMQQSFSAANVSFLNQQL